MKKIWIKLPLVQFYGSFMQNVKRSTPNLVQSRPLEYSLVFANFNKSPRRKLLEWIMNSVFNNSNEICCCNKEQCFTPTLLSWSSLQLSTKSFVNSASETGKYYLRLPTTFFLISFVSKCDQFFIDFCTCRDCIDTIETEIEMSQNKSAKLQNKWQWWRKKKVDQDWHKINVHFRCYFSQPNLS